LIGRKPVNLIVGWCGRFLFFIVPRQFSQDTGEWPENQILIPDWTDFHCPGTTQVRTRKKKNAQNHSQLGISFFPPVALFFFSAPCLGVPRQFSQHTGE